LGRFAGKRLQDDRVALVAGSFLHNGTTAMFERHGLARNRQIGKYRWVVRRFVG
jgi:hypothetical protein